MPVGKAENLRTEADREGLDRDAAPAGDEKMAKFVEKNDNRQNKQKADNRIEKHLP